MSRSERLLQLMQILRRHRYPISGDKLAEELGISLRTLYRDIASLQSQGAKIEGEAGLGYVLRPGSELPPLMFSAEEIEAILLGSRWVAERADARLGAAARDALAKISAVLPAALRHELEHSTLVVGPAEHPVSANEQLDELRRAIRSEHRVRMRYQDLNGKTSERIIWPFALAFFERARVVAAWCELRQSFRHFRTDRITALEILPDRYPRRRQEMHKAWRAENNIPAKKD
jgi:predicted DNA-binding transcriptional regulator YafY